MTPSNEPVRLEVFSDYTCPWCYIGWARLESARAAIPDDVQLAVEWRPFEIHPEVPLEGMPVEDLPYAPDVWARMQDSLRLSAAAEGLDVGKRPKVANTHRALLAGQYAQVEERDLFPTFHERLFKGYFAEGMDLGDPGVVDRLAEEAGLDVASMTAALRTGRFESDLEHAGRDARLMGITGTPTFVFDRVVAASGAQPAEVLVQAVQTVIDRRRQQEV